MGMDPISIAVVGTLLGATAANTGYSIYAGEQNAKRQESAQRNAMRQAEATAKSNEEAVNRANMKRPNVNAILAAAQNSAKSGVGSTMLTGPTGVDQSALSLGKSTLLGG